MEKTVPPMLLAGGRTAGHALWAWGPLGTGARSSPAWKEPERSPRAGKTAELLGVVFFFFFNVHPLHLELCFIDHDA